MPRLNFQFSILSLQFSVLFTFLVPAYPQATFPSPTLTSILPLGGKPGTSIQLTLRGGELDDPKAILLNERSIPITSAKGKVMDISLPADLKPARYDLRFVGRYGVSNPRVFEVSPHPILTSPGKNTGADTAFKITVGSVIQGAFKAGSPQWFSFDAKKGRSITASFDGLRFDTRTELVGVVSDATGHEVARMKNGLLAFDPPADGTYRLRLNDLMHRGGDDYGFRLALEQTPPVMLPNSSGPQPTAKPVKIGDTIKDIFPAEGEARVYDLAFKAGDKFVIEVLSHQLGHASDPHLFIELLKPDGTWSPIAQVADAPAITPAPALALASRDPFHPYEAKADGSFRISLNDNFNTTSPFELRVLPPATSAPKLIALNAALPQAGARKGYEFGTANVCRGGILALEVAASNRHALSEAIELKAETPPSGLTCLGGFIGKGQSLGYLAFQAAADAPAGGGLVSSISESAYVSFPVADAARDTLLTRRAGPPAIGVSTLSAPALVLTEKTDILEVAADGKLEIPLKVTRHAGFTDALKLKAHGLVDTAKAPEADVPAKANAGKLTLDVKALKLPPGEYGFILQGPAKMKVRHNLEELAKAESDQKKFLGNQKEAQKKLATAKADTTPQKDALIKTATEALKQADKAKTDIDKLIKDLTAKAAPKEFTFIVCSNPIRIRVAVPAPVAKK
ncbi:MAG: hypothetical protein ACO1TE_21030 [Prosthecobacter sp.]